MIQRYDQIFNIYNFRVQYYNISKSKHFKGRNRFMDNITLPSNPTDGIHALSKLINSY